MLSTWFESGFGSVVGSGGSLGRGGEENEPKMSL